MPFSHHSHSGQFCGHASNTLAEMVAEARGQQMRVFALTEHMPRDSVEELYPEEVAEGLTPADLKNHYAAFYVEARRLQSIEASPMELLVGAEIEWILPAAESKAAVEALLSTYQLDLFVGSVHHVYGIPIDIDHASYQRAMATAGQRRRSDGIEVGEVGQEKTLFADYFDAQYEMLRALQPPVVGHFDLIRLLSDSRDKELKQWVGLWKKIVRNLNFVADYGGCLEVNSAALRKGLQEPYPKKEIVEKFAEMGGRFVLSDDSHAVSQVGLNFQSTVKYLESCGVSKLSYFGRHGETVDKRFPGIGLQEVEIKDIKEKGFWKS